MSLKQWVCEGRELLADAGIFVLHRLRSRSPRTGELCSMSVLEARDWVNVVALTEAGDVVLVRQYRHGTGDFTLEIPGGMVDGGEDAAAAAARELLEETGYSGDPPLPLGVVTPNPAFLNNRCHTYLIANCRRVAEPAPEGGEDLEVSIRPLGEIPGFIAEGGIHHALVICAFWWLAQRFPRRFSAESKDLPGRTASH
jgi:8-oxo-dGTP pyrophosphatase MutT (NUDIX family)